MGHSIPGKLETPYAQKVTFLARREADLMLRFHTVIVINHITRIYGVLGVSERKVKK